MRISGAKSPGIVLFLLLFFIIGILLFLYGFFPSAGSNTEERSTFKDIPQFLDETSLNNAARRYVDKHVSRSILMIVDAMRYGFLAEVSMSYTMDQLRRNSTGRACLYKIKVDSPTVTMPRIKSITTGAISSFIDVVLNLGSSEVLSDSIIHQVYDRGERIVFYGDNTWTKLFPDMFHRKQENYDSFFVQDFYEGDKNITKRLASELKYTDWELMILHYLGLDHIGHVEGAYSTKVPDKLSEMDRVVQQIDVGLKRSSSFWKKPQILIVTADHGMRDSGGHGGSSEGEIFVPLVTIGLNCTPNSNTVYNQIDITPTIAVLFGFPIPASSIGTIIPELVTTLNREDQLFAFYYNTKRLVEKMNYSEGFRIVSEKDYWYDFQSAKEYHKMFLVDMNQQKENRAAFEHAKLRYFGASRKMSEKLIASFVRFDMFSVTIGLIQVIASTITLVLTSNFIPFEKSKSLSMWQWVVLSLIFSPILQRLLCQLFPSDTMLCTSNIFTLLIFGAITLSAFSHFYLFYMFKLKTFKMDANRFEILLFVATTFQGLTLFSSSFIEEEHQIWYYFEATAMFFFATIEFKTFGEVMVHKSNGIFKDKNEKRKLMVHFWSKNKSWLLIFTAHAFVRRLNQTGDKWLSIPDIGDWFVVEENKIWLSVFFCCSLAILATVITDYNGILTNVLCFTGIILIYLYRALDGMVLLFGISSSSSKTSVFLFWLNVLEIVLINAIPFLYELVISKSSMDSLTKNVLGTNITVFALISAILHKPHNVILVPVCIITLEKMLSACDRFYDNKSSTTAKVMLSYWIGRMFFFYQGNSNSLASIDLNPGYIGLESYNAPVVFVLVAMNTYCGPILCFLVLFYNIFKVNQTEDNKANVFTAVRTTAIIVMIPTCIYLIVSTISRHHLFIWTVFSPKLLYESFNVCFYFVILALTYCFFKIVNSI